MAKISKKAEIGLVAAAAVVIALAGGHMLNKRDKVKTAEDFGFIQETAEAGQISKVVNGTGALAADDSGGVKVPVGAKVLEIYVEEGDHIQKGDRIARFDAVSLKEIIVSLDENIDSQNEKIDDLDTSDKHYQEKLEIAQAAIRDLKQSREKAEALAKDPVLVSDREGIVSAVNLKEGEKTTQTLPGGGSDSFDSSILSTLLLGSSENVPSYRASEYTLVSMQTGEETHADQEENVSAPVTEAGESLPDSEAAPSADPEPDVSAAESDASAAGSDASVAEPDTEAAAQDSETVQGTESAGNAADQKSAKAAESESEKKDEAPSEPVKVQLVEIPFKNITIKLAAPAAGAVPQTGIALPDGSHIKASIVWVPSHERFVSGSVYIAVIALQADNGYCFPSDANVPEVKIDSCKDARISKYDLNADGQPDTILAVCPYITPPDSGDVEKAMAQLNELAEKEMTTLREQLEKQIGLLIENVMKGAGGNIAEVMKGIGSGMDFSGLDFASLTGSAFSGMDLGSLAGFGSADLGGLAGLQNSSGGSYYETDAITVIPNEKVFLDINIDEMDINMLSPGQAAQITVDAIHGREFEGEIIRIANTKTNETSITGGNSSAKYTVRISMPWDEQMKFGMTASASITADTHDNAVLVPVDAVMVLDGKDVVYTSFDGEGNLTEPVQVTTGLSDGTMVEITEGLKAGDTICYVNTQYQSLFHQLETVEVER